MAARREAVEAYLAEHHLSGKVLWHSILNNNHLTRPNAHGGQIVRAVSECKTYERVAPGSANAQWCCRLNLPNSFAPADGRRLQTEGYGLTQQIASEHACHQAVARLLMTEPSIFVLRPQHWKIPAEQLLEGWPGAETAPQALPVHVPARSREAGVGAETLTAAEVDERVADVIRRCLRTHGGERNPSRTDSRAVRREPGEEPV